MDWLFFVPPDLRRRAAQRVAPTPGGAVLEIGCGTGRNFPHLQAAVGPGGRIYGVDLSPGMLGRARNLIARNNWKNVHVTLGDAGAYVAPEPLDAILFGFSYNTMPHHRLVLQHAMSQLRRGGRLVILDGKLPNGSAGEWLLPFSLWLMRSTLLGNPLIQPWRDLAGAVEGFEMEQFVFGSWYICWGSKPLPAYVGAAAERSSSPNQQKDPKSAAAPTDGGF
ncbi:MAG: class I SAM-dependent methyltransferase [Xanthobacteraceae bacterium]